MAQYQEIANIVTRILNGDNDAFSELYEATYKSVFYHAQTLLKNNEDVEDAVSEAYLRAYQNLSKLKNPATFPAWINQIVTNYAMNHLRDDHFRGSQSLDDEDFFYEPAAPDSETPDLVLDQKGTEEIIGRMINTLPKEQRMTVILYYYDELSVADIAKTMECSAGTVKSRLNYARKAIEKAVREEEKRGVKLYSAISPALLAAAIKRLADNSNPAVSSVGNVARSLAAEYGYDAGRWSLSSASKAVSAPASAATASSAATAAGSDAAAAAKPTVEATTVGAKVKSATLLRILAIVAAVGIGMAVYFSYAPDPDAEETTPEEQVVYDVQVEEPEQEDKEEEPEIEEPEEEEEPKEEEPEETPEDIITEEEEENQLNPEADESGENELAFAPEPKTYYPGDLIDFGHYEQDGNLANGFEPITWQVLDIQDNCALLVSQYALDSMPYDGYYWENCSLREWLNNRFYLFAFSKAEQQAILKTEVDNSKAQQGKMGAIDVAGNSFTNSGPNTLDKVFLLSYVQANQYFPSADDLICMPTDFAVAQGAVKDVDRGSCQWWLRTRESNTDAGIVTTAGGIRSKQNMMKGMAVRPCIWVDLDSEIFR